MTIGSEAMPVANRGALGMRAVAPNGAAARLMLAFLGTAGLFYENIMPAIVSGLIDGLGFSNREAGLVGSANMYGCSKRIRSTARSRLSASPTCSASSARATTSRASNPGEPSERIFPASPEWRKPTR